MTTALQQFRLAIWDEGIGLGGIDRVMISLIPELGRQLRSVYWMLPIHRHHDVQPAIAGIPGIKLISLHGTFRSEFDRIVCAILKKVANVPAVQSMQGGRAIARRESKLRIESALRAVKAERILVSALFTQPAPQIDVPVFAIVHDTNYSEHWRQECRENLKRWSDAGAYLICISEFTRTEAIKVLGRATERLLTIPNAAGSVPAPPMQGQKKAAGREMAKLLYPASFHPHKGHDTLLAALRRLWDEGERFEVIFVGSQTEKLGLDGDLGDASLDRARSLLVSAPNDFRTCVRALGFQSFQDLENLYRSADLVVLPSRYEGFGLPLSEAMFRGTRVLCSDIPSFREHARLYGFEDRVNFAPPGEPSAWASLIRSALRGSNGAILSADEARLLQGRWTWQDAAKRYLEVLQLT